MAATRRPEIAEFIAVLMGWSCPVVPSFTTSSLRRGGAQRYPSKEGEAARWFYLLPDLFFCDRAVVGAREAGAALYGQGDLAQSADVLCGIGGNKDKIRELARLDAAHLLLQPHGTGVDHGGSMNCLQRRHARASDEQF